MIHVVSMSGTIEWIQVQKSMISTMNEIDIDEFDFSSVDGDIWINYIWWCESKEVNVNSTMISIPISSHLSTSYSLLFHINPSIQASFHVSSFRILWLKSILEWSEFKSVVIRYKYQQITKKRYTADNLLEYEFSWTLNTLLFCPYEFDSSFCSQFSW